MKKVLGIIAEYNPFHNGHLYHYIQAKKITQADYSIAIITGNFTQRGDTSIINKWKKAEMAVNNGIDLVLELPTIYSTSSAENFAEGSIKILNLLGIVTDIVFGSETEDINILNDLADVLYLEPPKYKEILSHELEKGLSYPSARANALLMYFNNIEKYSNILAMPNNILAIEYLKALKKTKSLIIPHAIKRLYSAHNSTSIINNLASGTAIRKIIKQKDFLTLKKILPVSSYSIIEEEEKKGHIVGGLNLFEKEIIFNLRKMSVSQILNLPDVSEGLEYKIKKAAQNCNNLKELIALISSKRYTSTRIQRILLYSILGITKDDILISKTITPYIRVLALNSKGKELLSDISKKNGIDVVTSVKKYIDSCHDEKLLHILEKDIWSSDVYTIAYKNDSKCNLDYTKKLIIIN